MISILHNPVERTRFLKFLVVGTLGAAIDFGIANLLTHFAGMPLVYAGTISFACAVISNFVWNHHWTYPESRSRHLAHQLGMFFIVNVAGIAIRVPILSFGEPPLQNFFQNLQLKLPFTPEFLARNLTLAIAVGIVMLWNFFVNRYWTYNDI
ncbi:MAG: GtrA family protein [Chloroflexi bacterium]|nr:GtrA family protein [Chloroflexota bacterium]